jgi:hypothetical protein
MRHRRPPRSSTTRLRHVSDLRPDPANANRGTTRGRALLATSLITHGAGRSVVADRHGVVIAGNKVVEHAKALSLPIQVVPTTGDALVVVQRTDLDLAGDSRARALAIADNRVAELDLEWDPAVLQQLRTQGLDVGTWWSETEWTKLVSAVATTDPKEDQVLAPAPTTIRRGDLFCARAASFVVRRRN